MKKYERLWVENITDIVCNNSSSFLWVLGGSIVVLWMNIVSATQLPIVAEYFYIKLTVSYLPSLYPSLNLFFHILAWPLISAAFLPRNIYWYTYQVWQLTANINFDAPKLKTLSFNFKLYFRFIPFILYHYLHLEWQASYDTAHIVTNRPRLTYRTD